ncbi:MAG: PD-(D/E)XK nuclease family protein [Bacillus sp. (in: firmicutes)]
MFKVREPLNKQSRMDPIETGNMIHRIIETLYREVKGVPFAKLAEFFQGSAEAKLESIFEVEWEKLKRIHPEISQIKLDKAKQDWWKKFRRWLAAEQERFWHNGELAEMRIFSIEEPVELSFMLENNEELTLSGKIDRVDIDEHGFVIYDYKTSDKNLDFNNHIPAGVVLQIPLYLMALAYEFNQGKYQNHKINHGEAIGGGYISMKDPHRRKQNMVWKDQDHRVRFEPNKKYKTNIVNLESESLRHELKLDELITRLWRGTFTDFSVRPFNADECKYCIYKPVCRVTTEQQNI